MPARNGSGIALLADPTRLRIVALLSRKPSRPSDVARELGLGRPAISRQLGLLEDAGLVVRHRWPVDRRVVRYALDPRQIGPIIAWLAGTDIANAHRGATRDPGPNVD